MVTTLQPGQRLRSVTCATEVVVTMADFGDLTCGGVSMVEADGTEAPSTLPAAPAADRSLLGKRYRAPDGSLEVLCVRQGRGPLEFDGEPLQVVLPKTLPASD